MKENTGRAQTGRFEADLPKEEFAQYLKVLFPLIEGSSDPIQVRNMLGEYLSGNEVPAEIDSMLRDLFLTKFNQPL